MSDQRSVFRTFVDTVERNYRAIESNEPIGDEGWTSTQLDKHKQNDPPIVSFIRSAGVIQPTDRTGVHIFLFREGEDDEQLLFFTAKVEDVATVECHITAENECQLERIHNTVLRAVRDTLGKFTVPGTYSIPTQTDEGSAEAHGGMQKLIQLFEWTILVPHTVGTLKTLGGITFTAILNDTVDKIVTS